MNPQATKTTLQRKLVTWTSICLIIVSITALLSYFYIFHLEYKQRFNQRLISLVNVAALMIDARTHEQLKTRNNEGKLEYQKLREMLFHLKTANPDINSIYTLRKTNKENVWEYVISTGNQHIGDPFYVPAIAQIQKAFSEPVTDKITIFNNRWGTSLSAYAPIKDKTGMTYAIVGLDVDLKTLITNEIRLLLGAFLIFLITMGVAVLLFFKIIKKAIAPVSILLKGIKENQDDKIGDNANAVSNSDELLLNYDLLLTKITDLSQKQDEKLYKAYKDVIYATTQGKFTLLTPEQISSLEEDTQLSRDLTLETSEDINRARELAENILLYQGYSPKRVRQVVLCVSEAVTNVIKHAQAGELRILQGKDFVRFIIKDQGPGMDLDKLPNMVFLNGFSTKVSMGYGFTILNKFTNTIYLYTSPAGTILGLDFKNNLAGEGVSSC